METGHSPEIQPPFITDFSRAMQLCADSLRLVETPEISRVEYVRAFCVAIIAANIAEQRLNSTNPSKFLTPEDLGLSFEQDEPKTLTAIIQKGLGSAGYHFELPAKGGRGTIESPDETVYGRELNSRFGRQHFKNNSDGAIADGVDFLHAILENDPRVVFKPEKRKNISKF